MSKFERKLNLFCLFLLFTSVGFIACRNTNQVNQRLSTEMPGKFLWAWERSEDLRFIDTRDFGVAFLAQTLNLERDIVAFNPRRQPLEVLPDTYLIAVTRIETRKDDIRRPTYSSEQITKIVTLIKKTIERPNVKAVQIDFDVVKSERGFYRNIVTELKSQLPPEMPFTITSLASWCVGESWFNDFPIDEAVPMAFQMGADNDKIRKFLMDGNDWNEPLCRGSYGVALEEPLKNSLIENRRVYYFKNSAWTPADLATLSK